MPYLFVHTQGVKSMQAAARHKPNNTHDAMLLYHTHHLLSSYHKIRYVIQNKIRTNAVQCTNTVHYNAKLHIIPKLKKGKGYPATGQGGPRGSRLVKVPDFLDIQHYKGGSSSAICTGHLHPRRNHWYSFSEAESTPGHMVLSEPQKKSPATPPGIDPGTVRLVAQCLNHYATPGPTQIKIPFKLQASFRSLRHTVVKLFLWTVRTFNC